jgi:acetyl-CoA carboxylase biotin carboxyl carrier protein
MAMNLKEVKQLMEWLEESGMTDFEWTTAEGEKIVIRREKEVVAAAPVAMAAPAPIAAPVAPVAQAVSSEPAVAASSSHGVTSPMVGTFYSKPSPTDDVFVKVGDRVRKGQTLCIVEAMKLMNEIESDVDGVVESMCIEEGEPVEFGTVLFRVKAD